MRRAPVQFDAHVYRPVIEIHNIKKSSGAARNIASFDISRPASILPKDTQGAADSCCVVNSIQQIGRALLREAGGRVVDRAASLLQRNQRGPAVGECGQGFVGGAHGNLLTRALGLQLRRSPGENAGRSGGQIGDLLGAIDHTLLKALVVGLLRFTGPIFFGVASEMLATHSAKEDGGRYAARATGAALVGGASSRTTPCQGVPTSGSSTRSSP